MSATAPQPTTPLATAKIPPTQLTDDLVRGALDTARERAQALDSRIEALVSERDNARREMQLLSELLAVRDGTPEATSAPYEDAKSPHDAPPVPARSSGAHPAAAAAVRELELAGKALHISELMRLLEEKSIRIPGAGNQANLIAHLMRHPAVVRPSRGMYALAAWGDAASPPLKTSDRKRVKGPSRIRK